MEQTSEMQKYKNAYENWYCVSCIEHGEEPISFEIYLTRAPLSLVEEINDLLGVGTKPC